MRGVRTITAAIVASALVAACAAGDDAGSDGAAGQSEDVGRSEPGLPEPGASDVGDAPPIELVADLSPDDAATVGAAVTEFGFDLLGELADGSENVIVSPLSVATLLSMVMAGADGQTADAMAEALHMDDPRDARSGALLDALADAGDVTLSVANALWAAFGVPFEPAYTDAVTSVFDATIEEADLASQATADEIDEWVVEHTEGLIDGIADDLGLPDPSAVLVLLNAVYFLGEWTTQFDVSRTVDEPFTRPDGSTVDVPLMTMRDATFGVTARPGYRMLRLPYGADERFGMEIILPDTADGLPDVLGRLDGAEWRDAAAALTQVELSEIAIPKFELTWDDTLTDALVELGMGIAFTPASDFTPMSPVDPWLDTVVHKTYLRVDEEGTEAAAVTGGMMTTSAMADPLTFRVDRPFAFTISDSDTGTVLFTGAVTDPTAD